MHIVYNPGHCLPPRFDQQHTILRKYPPRAAHGTRSCLKTKRLLLAFLRTSSATSRTSILPDQQRLKQLIKQSQRKPSKRYLPPRPLTTISLPRLRLRIHPNNSSHNHTLTKDPNTHNPDLPLSHQISRLARTAPRLAVSPMFQSSSIHDSLPSS